MIYEVAAAVDYILSLVQRVERTEAIPSEALAGFGSTLKDELEKRCQSSWCPADPEKGSASRSIAWQLHAGGEGADSAILRAISSVIEAQAEEGEIVHPKRNQVVTLALSWLPNYFTMWIDPGCVAIRLGAGPGSNRTFFENADVKSTGDRSGLTGSINVVWGQMSLTSADQAVPGLTVSNNTSFTAPSAPRPIPIVKPTATTAASASSKQRYPLNSMSNGRPAAHQRSMSNASSTDFGGLTRSVSLSSTKTASTEATSFFSEEARDGEESDACPSLVSPSASSTSSRSTVEAETADNAHDTTLIGEPRFAGAKLFSGDGEEEDDAGDVTIQPDQQPLGLQREAVISSTPKYSKVANKSANASTAVAPKCNYTTHDNGNVGVLGGGVRLGGGATKSSNNTQAPRHRQHSNSKSVGQIQGFNGQMYPHHQVRYQQHHVHHYQQNPQFFSVPQQAGNYSAPIRTVPLPAVAPFVPSALQSQHHQQCHPAAAAPQAYYPHAAIGVYEMMAKQQQQQQHSNLLRASQNAPGPYLLPVPSNLASGDEEMEGPDGKRRNRSRGRRSRGRGAGRAARRAAAALQAQNQDGYPLSSSLLDLHDLDDGELETNSSSISRCSTPSTSSANDQYYSSCFSSVNSTPAKNVGKTLIQEDEGFDFDMELQSGLARLQLAA